MSLDLSKLQKIVELGEGVKRARCPACAESGSDKTGQHLRIYPDGKFGCCVHPGDSEHRKRIYALAGEDFAVGHRRGIKVRFASAKTVHAIQSGVLGRLGRTFGSSDGPDGVIEVESMSLESEESRTLRTGEPNWNIDTENVETELRTDRTGQTECTEELCNNERTLRTPQLSLVLQQEDSEIEKYKKHIYKDVDEGVRCVRGLSSRDNVSRRGNGEMLPHLTPSGDLVIPFGSPDRYHWWKGGQSVKETLAELRERAKEIENGTTF